MFELTSKRSLKSHIVSDEDYKKIVQMGIIGRYLVVELPEIKQLKPILKFNIETKPNLEVNIETKKVLKTKK